MLFNEFIDKCIREKPDGQNPNILISERSVKENSDMLELIPVENRLLKNQKTDIKYITDIYGNIGLINLLIICDDMKTDEFDDFVNFIYKIKTDIINSDEEDLDSVRTMGIIIQNYLKDDESEDNLCQMNLRNPIDINLVSLEIGKETKTISLVFVEDECSIIDNSVEVFE